MAIEILRHEKNRAYLYFRDTGKTEPQPCYLELDVAEHTIYPDFEEQDPWDQTSFSRGLLRRYPIPALTIEAAYRAAERIAPIAERIAAGWTAADKRSPVVLTADAQLAEAEVFAALGCNATGWPVNQDEVFGPADRIVVVTPLSLLGVQTWSEAMAAADEKVRAPYGIAADTPDRDLSAICERIAREASDAAPSGVAVTDGMFEFLEQVRNTTPPVMSGAEFRAARDLMGLSGPWVAARLQVDARTVRRWEGDRAEAGAAIPPTAAGVMADMLLDAFNQVADLINWLEATKAPMLILPRDDEELLPAQRMSGYPASWHRAVMARAARQAAHRVRLFYSDEAPE